MRTRPARHGLVAALLGLVLVALPNLGTARPPAPVATVSVAMEQAEAVPAPAPAPAATAAPPQIALPDPTPAPPAPVATEPPAPPPTPEPVAPAAVAPAPLTLEERLAATVAATTLNPGGTLGIAVIDEAGTPVYDFDADRALLPASTQKLPVAAAALARLGPDFRFRTEIAATGPMAGGVLDGDLVLVGGIDPALGTPAFAAHVNPKRPRTPLEALADQVARIGIAHISGDVLGDASVLPDEPVAPGWLDRYLRSGNTARSSGLTVDGGRRVFVEGGRWRSLPADDPAAQAAIALAELLLERGITIGGGAGAAPGSGAGAAVIGQVHSPPLIDLLRTTVQASDNHLADAIFRAVGRADGDGTWAGAARATSRALAPLGLAFEPAALADGSGLSRSDRLSAAALVELDRRVTASPAGAQWRSLMAVSGESGTLRRRLVGTVAQGRLLGKTGSLQDVRALSGAVEGPDGRRYHFAVIGNDLDEAGREAVRALQDAVVLALAEDLDGCRLVPAVPPVPAAPTDVGAPVDEGTPARLDCAA